MPLHHVRLLCLASLCGAVLSGQTISFLPPVNAFSGGASRASSVCNTCVAAADFDGDGKMDIVYSGTVQTPFAGVLLGNGDGTFRNGFVFAPEDFGPPSVGDFNGDGKPDIVFFGTVARIYLGKGDGTFNAPFSVAACTKVYLSDGTPVLIGNLPVADVNRDGKDDLLCGSAILLSQADGTFHASSSTLGGNAALVADFNADGNSDVLLSMATAQFAVAPGRGDGTFGPAIPLSNSLGIPTFHVGDFNGDGRTDLVGASKDGTSIAVLPGRGDGTFGPPITTAGVPGAITASADFNQDRKLDLIVGDAVLAGNGDGTFRSPVFIGIATESCNPDYRLAGGRSCDYSHLATAVADFNKDGLPDIVSGYLLSGYQNMMNASFSVMLSDSPGDGFTTTGVSSATGTWPVAGGSLVSAFGVNLAPGTEAAAPGPLPTTLGGIRVHVGDRSQTGDNLAPLLFVSPTQINYVFNSADPFARIGIERVGSPFAPKGMSVPASLIAPGLFTVGAGLAAANTFTFTPFAQVTLPVTSCNGPVCTSIPLDLSGSPVYLSLYGTGFSLAATAASTCTIAGKTLPVTYAGPQRQLPGLDQINLLLPSSLAGAGDTSISCAFGPQEISPPHTNPVKLNIR